MFMLLKNDTRKIPNLNIKHSQNHCRSFGLEIWKFIDFSSVILFELKKNKLNVDLRKEKKMLMEIAMANHQHIAILFENHRSITQIRVFKKIQE